MYHREQNGRYSSRAGADPNVNSYSSVWSFSDGLGREFDKLTPADPTAGDLGDWLVVLGVVFFFMSVNFRIEKIKYL